MDARSTCRIVRGQGPLSKHGRAVRSRVFSLASLWTNRENVPKWPRARESLWIDIPNQRFGHLLVHQSERIASHDLSVSHTWNGKDSKGNGGFIDQKTFKPAEKYGFDSVILTDTRTQLLDGYINFVRPLLKPHCDFVLVTKNGSQHSKLGNEMSKLVFDAIGKYIHPTRYRQIVETQSLHELNDKEHRVLSEDQKHSSVVAKVHYQKRRSRKVAVKAHECLQKLQGTKGSEVDIEVNTRFGSSNSSLETVIDRTQSESASLKTHAPPPSNRFLIQRRPTKTTF